MRAMVESAMKSKLLGIVATAALVTISLSAAAIESLRGEAITDKSTEPEKRKVEVVQGGIERSYKEQPPLIPHDIEKYEISLQHNGCLKCHSETTYEREKAPKAGDSHYIDRDGKKLEHISMRRWFCNQCHAVQLSGAPLVKNDFQGRK